MHRYLPLDQGILSRKPPLPSKSPVFWIAPYAWTACHRWFARMYLREVIFNGFKSFADRTRIQLDPGVTCIVGPNGCGKSNIVDAIRWVLGEQSAKALRGNKMHDVIFQGTDRRKALPACEVSLMFSDCEAELGTQFNEVEITRKVDREGGGDYFINGKKCRLKDIQRLFMDTGVGRASYSFMMQGQIDQILSSNPQERRTIFEEAAGITKYKAQRKEALNKLALVDQNLSRVTDVIEEVGRQIGSLRRQASKALRYKRFKHRLSHLDLASNAYHYQQRFAGLSAIEENARGLREIVGRAAESMKVRESELEERKSARGQQAEDLREMQQTLFDLRSEKENADNSARFASVRLQEAEERIASIAGEIESMEHQLQDLGRQAEITAESKKEALGLVQSSDQAFRSRNESYQAILAGIADTERKLAAKKQDMLVKEGNITRYRSQCTSFEVDLKSFQVKHAALGDQIHELTGRLAEGERGLQAILETRHAREAARGRADEAVEAARGKVASLRERFKDLQRQIQESDRELARQSARLSTLEGLQQRFEGFSDGAKAILKGGFKEILPGRSFRPLSSIIEVDDGHTAALEVLLGNAAEAIHLDHFDTVGPVLRQLRESVSGRACLQVQRHGVTPSAPAANTLPEGMVAATSVVRARKEEFEGLVRDFFSGCYFCRDLDSLLEYWKAHPDFDFELVATKDGELVDRRGLIYGGSSAGKGKDDSSFIQRETLIRKLKASIAGENERLTTLNEESMALQASIEEAEAAVEAARKEAAEIGEELSSLKAEERSANETNRQNSESLQRSRRQLQELEQSRTDAETRLQKAREEMLAAEQAIEQGRQAIDEFDRELVRLRGERDAHQEGLTQVRLDLAEKKQRLELIDRGLNEAQKQRLDLEERLVRRRQETDMLAEQIESLRGEIETNNQRAGEIERTLGTTRRGLEERKAKLDALEAQIGAAEKDLQQTRETQRTHESQLGQMEVKLAEERSQARFLADKVQSEYDLDITGVDWKAQLWKADEEFETKLNLDELDDEDALKPKARKDRGDPDADDLAAMDNTDWDEVAREVKYLRDRINSLGAVNLVAIEEYAELRERYDFLKSQSDDLWKSKEALLEAIDEINTTSKSMFEETFDQIRKNFRFTFEKLFAGGFADLELIEAEDVLDSGIEITARPPGTKLQSLSLLSGGQRTMTAVALLFAIYMVKPSPFAVLDELDAPLDDANIGRFTDMLKDFVRYSQFLVVTHNKRTVSAANSIYGVTMQERGVTKLVSMRFDHKSQRAEEVEEAGGGI